MAEALCGSVVMGKVETMERTSGVDPPRNLIPWQWKMLPDGESPLHSRRRNSQGRGKGLAPGFKSRWSHSDSTMQAKNRMARRDLELVVVHLYVALREP